MGLSEIKVDSVLAPVASRRRGELGFRLDRLPVDVLGLLLDIFLDSSGPGGRGRDLGPRFMFGRSLPRLYSARAPASVTRRASPSGRGTSLGPIRSPAR